jgi:hypothetical protein
MTENNLHSKVEVKRELLTATGIEPAYSMVLVKQIYQRVANNVWNIFKTAPHDMPKGNAFEVGV